MISKKNVQGMTAAGWMIIIAIVLFFIYLAIKLIPAYIEFSNVKSLAVSTSQMGLANQPNDVALEKFTTKLSFARIKFLTKDDYKIVQDKTGKYLLVDYDKKIPMFGNVSVLIEFEHKQKL